MACKASYTSSNLVGAFPKCLINAVLHAIDVAPSPNDALGDVLADSHLDAAKTAGGEFQTTKRRLERWHIAIPCVPRWVLLDLRREISLKRFASDLRDGLTFSLSRKFGTGSYVVGYTK